MKIIIIQLLHFVNLVMFLERAYYKWLHREIPKSEQKNRFIADEIEKIHTDSPDKGYRRIRDDLERYHGIDVNDKIL
ncbi:MAG: IS3 family transposase [Lachnospiraceae bacterium]